MRSMQELAARGGASLVRRRRVQARAQAKSDIVWPAGHPQLTGTPDQGSNATLDQGLGSARTTPVQVPRNRNTPKSAQTSTAPRDDASGGDRAPEVDRYAELLSKFQQLESRIFKTESTTERLEREGAGVLSTAVSLSTEFSRICCYQN